MKLSPQNPPLALWLDALAPMKGTHRDRLQAFGWQVQPVDTLDALLGVPGAPVPHLRVLRLHGDAALLEELVAELRRRDALHSLVCRVDRSAVSLTVAAARLGVPYVLAADDDSESSWQPVLCDCAPMPARPAVPEPACVDREVVFVDPLSQHLLALARRVAQADVTALLVGPTGSGKEVLARLLHSASPRAQGPFVALNCAALPETLMEALLFGHEKGAFTGALREHRGLLEQAHGGSLFLDEIGDMPTSLQAKMLRVLQERQLTRLGGQTVVRLDVRIIAATHKDLRAAMQAREFREDLYYRISTFRLRVPALCERPGDILPLARHVLRTRAGAHGPYEFSAAACEALRGYHWPGNVRELENVMLRATVLSSDGYIDVPQLLFDDGLDTVPGPLPLQPPPVAAPTGTAGPQDDASEAPAAVPQPQPDAAQGEDLHAAVRHSEGRIILAAIAAAPTRQEAARRLGISPRTLRYKLAQLRAGTPSPTHSLE